VGDRLGHENPGIGWDAGPGCAGRPLEIQEMSEIAGIHCKGLGGSGE
jgi:hypothetical protein